MGGGNSKNAIDVKKALAKFKPGFKKVTQTRHAFRIPGLMMKTTIGSDAIYKLDPKIAFPHRSMFD